MTDRDGRLEKELRGRFRRALPPALTAAGVVVLMRARRIFILFRPAGWASGATIRSLTVSPPEAFRGGMRVKIGPTTSYAYWTHFGRKPGRMPPIDNILAGIREKHLVGTYEIVGTGVGRYPRYGRYETGKQREAEDLRAAWAIAKSIARKGTKGFPFLIVALRQSKRDAVRVFERVLVTEMVVSRYG